MILFLDGEIKILITQTLHYNGAKEIDSVVAEYVLLCTRNETNKNFKNY